MNPGQGGKLHVARRCIDREGTMTAIFISHSSADNQAAAEMKAWLKAQGHTSLFLDFDPEAGIRGGAAWEQTLYKNLRQCQAVIALLTPDWLASKWCFAELVQARERGKAIFPVKVCCPARQVISLATSSTLISPSNGRKAMSGSESACWSAGSIRWMCSTGTLNGCRIPASSPSRNRMRRSSLAAVTTFSRPSRPWMHFGAKAVMPDASCSCSAPLAAASRR
ncbi:hypothetical protein BZM27_07710 [Paraburkholderia steynii]|uniref:TIR domain-containing protein n=1 Tax=Paraburkholderia steynii TaxID=1245441 RepID=A0A4R0XFL5_9BURK|nr:hypothetical protein BZM27_07710 [Paraburkholderia steynii]